MAFDKTGTLTEGKIQVIDCICYCGDIDITQSINAARLHLIFDLLLSAERRSNHPIAKGIIDYCMEQIKILENGGHLMSAVNTQDLFFENVMGKGVRMNVHDSSGVVLHTLIVGSADLLIESEVSIPQKAEQMAYILRSNAKIVVFVALDGKLVTLLGMGDMIKPEARRIIEHLHCQGIECHMVTGDNVVTACAIAKILRIPRENVRAGASPADKEQYVADMQSHFSSASSTRNKVAFVGDGTNDTPALTRAQVGIVMSSGTDLALECGDVVLCRNNLESLVIAMDLSQHTMRRIYMNYFWALIYNSILIPIAAGVLLVPFSFKLNPMVAGGAMAVSSVSVVLSSLFLNFYSPPSFKKNLGFKEDNFALLSDIETGNADESVEVELSVF